MQTRHSGNHCFHSFVNSKYCICLKNRRRSSFREKDLDKRGHSSTIRLFSIALNPNLRIKLINVKGQFPQFPIHGISREWMMCSAGYDWQMQFEALSVRLASAAAAPTFCLSFQTIPTIHPSLCHKSFLPMARTTPYHPQNPRPMSQVSNEKIPVTSEDLYQSCCAVMTPKMRKM